jgi:hypothetical protein
MDDTDQRAAQAFYRGESQSMANRNDMEPVKHSLGQFNTEKIKRRREAGDEDDDDEGSNSREGIRSVKSSNKSSHK